MCQHHRNPGRLRPSPRAPAHLERIRMRLLPRSSFGLAREPSPLASEPRSHDGPRRSQGPEVQVQVFFKLKAIRRFHVKTC